MDAGSGRLNIGRAFNSTLVIQPPEFVAYLSSNNPTWQQVLEFKSFDDNLENIEVNYEGPEIIQVSPMLEGNILKINLGISGESFGDFEGRIIVNQNDDKYMIPFLLHYTKGSISVSQDTGKLNFKVFSYNFV